MTHGEAWYVNKQKLQEIPSLNLEDELQKIKLPPKMSKEEAVRYYNKKLFDYFVSSIKTKTKKRVKKSLVSFLMFGNPNIYEKLEKIRIE